MHASMHLPQLVHKELRLSLYGWRPIGHTFVQSISLQQGAFATFPACSTWRDRRFVKSDVQVPVGQKYLHQKCGRKATSVMTRTTKKKTSIETDLSFTNIIASVLNTPGALMKLSKGIPIAPAAAVPTRRIATRVRLALSGEEDCDTSSNRRALKCKRPRKKAMKSEIAPYGHNQPHHMRPKTRMIRMGKIAAVNRGKVNVPAANTACRMTAGSAIPSPPILRA